MKLQIYTNFTSIISQDVSHLLQFINKTNFNQGKDNWKSFFQLFQFVSSTKLSSMKPRFPPPLNSLTIFSLVKILLLVITVKLFAVSYLKIVKFAPMLSLKIVSWCKDVKLSRIMENTNFVNFKTLEIQWRLLHSKMISLKKYKNPWWKNNFMNKHLMTLKKKLKILKKNLKTFLKRNRILILLLISLH